MASALEALASGLRGAGGIISPEVQKMDEAQRRQEDAQAEGRRNLMAQMTIRGAESGAIDPVSATRQLRSLGLDVPDGAIGPTPEAMARQQAYKNDLGFRDAVSKLQPNDSYGIAKAAAQFGKPELAMQMYQREEDRIDKSQARTDALQERSRQFDIQMQQKDLDRDVRERIATAADETKRLIASSTAETARMRVELQNAKADQIKDEGIRKQTRQLSQDLNKANLPEIDAVLGNVEKALKNTPELAQYIATPNALRPDWTLPAEIRNGKQDFQKLFNITLKNRSGAAVTNQELERLKQEFGAGVFKTPEQIQDAVTKIRGIVEKHYAGIAAGYGKDVLSAYNDNLRDVGGSVVLEPGKTKVVNFSEL